MNTQQSLTPAIPSPVSALAEVANRAAEQTVLARYQSRKAAQTLRRQSADIALFETFLSNHAGVLVEHMAYDLEAWSHVSHGLVEAWLLWMLSEGYSIGSINVRLSTTKIYASLAFSAHYLSQEAYSLIRNVKGFRQAEGRNQDDKRPRTRREKSKKAEATPITIEQARLLKQPSDTKRDRRDRLLCCLLIEHGLRCGEVASLNVSDIDLVAGTLTFYRHKVDMIQTLELERNTLLAARAYLEQGPKEGPLFTSSLILQPYLRKSDGGNRDRIEVCCTSVL